MMAADRVVESPLASWSKPLWPTDANTGAAAIGRSSLEGGRLQNAGRCHFRLGPAVEGPREFAGGRVGPQERRQGAAPGRRGGSLLRLRGGGQGHVATGKSWSAGRPRPPSTPRPARPRI